MFEHVVAFTVFIILENTFKFKVTILSQLLVDFKLSL